MSLLKISKSILISACLFITAHSFSDSTSGARADFDPGKPAVNQQALNSHNKVRAQVRQRPLKVSKDLTQIAQKWANQLARSCQMYHQKDAPFGENVGRSGGPSNINTIINAWASEKRNYNLKQNTCPKGKQCYHYTQMVWAGTTEIGCAKQRCTNGSGAEIYVCNYFPAGNIVGARPFKP